MGGYLIFFSIFSVTDVIDIDKKDMLKWIFICRILPQCLKGFWSFFWFVIILCFSIFLFF